MDPGFEDSEDGDYSSEYIDQENDEVATGDSQEVADYADDFASDYDYEETTYDYDLAEEPLALEDEQDDLEDLDDIAVDATVTLELGEGTVRDD